MNKTFRRFSLVTSLTVMALFACGDGEDTVLTLHGVLYDHDESANSFNYLSGYAKFQSSDSSYRFYFFNDAPSNGKDPWESGADQEKYPQVNFATTSLEAQSISLSGQTGGKKVLGYIEAADCVSLDAGTVVIESYDEETGIISGRVDATTLDEDEDSALTGSFSVELAP